MWKVIKKDVNGATCYLYNSLDKKPMLFKSIVEAKQFLANYLKLTDFDIKVEGIYFEEVNENDDK